MGRPLTKPVWSCHVIRGVPVGGGHYVSEAGVVHKRPEHPPTPTTTDYVETQGYQQKHGIPYLQDMTKSVAN
jgi:hypothetical protein